MIIIIIIIIIIMPNPSEIRVFRFLFYGLQVTILLHYTNVFNV